MLWVAVNAFDNMLLRSSHRAQSCASWACFHKWIIHTEHLLPWTQSDWKRDGIVPVFYEIQGKA